jgi:hypothetical protein
MISFIDVMVATRIECFRFITYLILHVQSIDKVFAGQVSGLVLFRSSPSAWKTRLK